MEAEFRVWAQKKIFWLGRPQENPGWAENRSGWPLLSSLKAPEIEPATRSQGFGYSFTGPASASMGVEEAVFFSVKIDTW